MIEWKILEFEKYAVHIEMKWYLSADVFPSTSFSQMTKIVKVRMRQSIFRHSCPDTLNLARSIVLILVSIGYENNGLG